MCYWIFKNTFSSKMLNLKTIPNLNINKIRDFKYKDNFGKVICNNLEILNYKKYYINHPIFDCNLSIIHNDWKYPFPNNFIPIFYNTLNLDIIINYNNKKYFINEYMKINIHHPSPYDITCNYKLKMDNNFIESRKIKGEMNYKTLDRYLITNNTANELFKYIENQIEYIK
jgi:hypothetical protein